MGKRLLDLSLAGLGLLLTGPVMALAALAVRLADPGPVIYRARRVGRGGRLFTMYKFRTMRVGADRQGAITAQGDPRVFGVGAVLRKLKIDELPQLFNVLRGDMSIVGPRPEAPEIVDKYYSAFHRETLQVLPGLASPGSIYNYTHGEAQLGGEQSDERYAEVLLDVKLALDVVYVRHQSVVYDIRIMLRTIRTIAAMALGKQAFQDPPEMEEARQLLRRAVADAAPGRGIAAE